MMVKCLLLARMNLCIFRAPIVKKKQIAPFTEPDRGAKTHFAMRFWDFLRHIHSHKLHQSEIASIHQRILLNEAILGSCSNRFAI